MIQIKRDYEKDKLVVLVDMDGTAYNLNEVWLSEYNRKFNNNVTIDEFEEYWDFHKLIESGKCNRDDIFSILDEEGFYYDHVKLYPYARDVLYRLYSDPRIMLYIASSSQDGFQMKEKGDVIIRDLDFLPTSRLILTRHKWMIKGDVIFDDKPETIRKCKRAGMITVAKRFKYNEKSKPDYFVNTPLDFENIILNDVLFSK